MSLKEANKTLAINMAVMGMVTTQGHTKQSNYNRNHAWCDLRIDSLDLVEIIMDLEEAFSVEMTEKEYDTPADLIAELNKQVKEL